MTPSHGNPAADTLVTVVVYVPDGAFFRVNVTVPLVPVVPLASHDRVIVVFVRITETDAPATALPRLSLRATVTMRSLFLVLPPARA